MMWTRMHPAPTRSPTHERVGRYLLLRSLGEGGMGEVFLARAHAAAGVEKDLCIKRIRRERLARRESVERFIEEARLSMRLNHGNIVQVFDFGRAGDEYFLAMEWVDGADVGRVLDGAEASGDPLDPLVAVHVAACVARALAYAHEPPSGGRPVVHCDLKPSNVLISRGGDVKLADFGAAATTGADFVGGTRGYMAPERSATGAADPKVDLYSLGVVLVELLSGEAPPHDQAAHAKVPVELRPLVASLLASDPHERPSSAGAVAEQLESWVSKGRAAGGIVPSADLARRAAALAIHAGQVHPRDMPTDASFELDGADAARFRDRMTETTQSTPLARADAVTTPEARPTGRPWLVAAALVAASAGAAWFALAGPDRSIHREAPATPATTATAPPNAPRSPEPRPAPTPAMDVVADAGARPTVVGPSASARRAPPVTSEAPGTFDVNAIPWAHVSMDGRALGDTPLFGVEASAGRHRFSFTNPALGATRNVTVVLEAGAHQHVVVRLEGSAAPDEATP